MLADAARFLTRRSERVGDCILWKGTVRANGDGQCEFKNKKYRAHRLAYMVDRSLSELSEDVVVYQTCGNKLCINPFHLEAKPRAEFFSQHQNVGARNARKTHCPKGHPYAPGKRHCLECRREYMREYVKRIRPRGDGSDSQAGVVGHDSPTQAGVEVQGGADQALE